MSSKTSFTSRGASSYRTSGTVAIVALRRNCSHEEATSPFDPGRGKHRLALRAAEVAHESPGNLRIDSGGHRDPGVRRIVLHFRRQRADQLQALVAVESNLGELAETHLLALALEHMPDG